MRQLAKNLAHGAAVVCVTPALVSFKVRSWFLGRDRALQGSTQALAVLPGLLGQYLRRAFLCQVLAECHRSCCIEFGAVFSRAGARIRENAYIGPRSHIGLADIGKDVMLAACVHVPSGGRTHGTDDASLPMREQEGRLRMVTIGEGAWIGQAAVVLEDVGCHSIVGAGAVVTRPVPDHVVAAGVPARVVRSRLSPDRQSPQDAGSPGL